MPPAKAKKSNLRAKPKGKRRPYKKVARRGNSSEYASLSCVATLTPGQNNVMYNRMNTQLADFPRAVNVAKSYQFYRIKQISLRLKSPYDTWIQQGIGYQKPYLYYMLDKSGSIPTTVTLEGLKNMGAKPRPLDEKTLSITWAPSVLEFAATQVAGGIGLPNRYKISPWLSTTDHAVNTLWNASTVDHLGVYWGVFAAATGSPTGFFYDVEIEVQFQFKGPLINVLTLDTPAVALPMATINNSVDGIVGGPDGV